MGSQGGMQSSTVGYMDSPFASSWVRVSVSVQAAMESAHPRGVWCHGMPGNWSKGQP